MLKPQDLLVSLKLLVLGEEARSFSFSGLAGTLGLSASETHAAVKRAVRCHLLSSLGSDSWRRHSLPSPSLGHLMRFVESGLPYVFPAERGSITAGMPTGIGAAPLREELVVGNQELVPVWPCGEGGQSGIALEPLYRSCPFAASNDRRLHRILALVDAIRDDVGARQRQVALRLFDVEARSVAAAPAGITE